MLKIGIVGCGLIGSKRAASLLKIKNKGILVACADTDFNKAKKLSSMYLGVKAYNSWQELINHPDLDVVIVSTLHDSLAEISKEGIKADKHIFVEKPAAKSSNEILPIIELTKKFNKKVRVGFNHRYHRAFQKAKSIVDNGELGDLMFIRARYGHGARIGYEKEWRANPELSGGGELIDQGPHLIDLSQWFFDKPLNYHAGSIHTYFWDMTVDDNAFLILKTSISQTAFLHVSCTEWKNTFSFEIYGKDGKLDINGLGGSYGVEKLTYYKMLPEMGPPQTTIFEYPMQDNSWEIEMEEFLDDINENRTPECDINAAYNVMRVIEDAYRK